MDKNTVINKKIPYILPTVHFLLSFVYERFVLKFNDDAAVAFSTPMNDTFSKGFEKATCYVISNCMAGIVIFLLWKLFFMLLKKKIDREVSWLFGIILAVSVALTVLQWPEVFTRGGDNYIPYSYAIRLVPEYWHSIYLSCLYTASLLVFPHAVSINVLQCALFVLAVGYLYNRIKLSPVFEKARWVRFLVLLMFFFKDTWIVATNPERAEYNASFTLIFVTLILFDILEKKKRPISQLVGILIFAAFLAVFRSEGLIVGILGFLALFFTVYRPKLSRAICFVAGLIAAYIVFSLPSKVGDVKYYGKDYSIINAFDMLSDVFNKPDSNLNYRGAEEDLAAIAAVTPIEVIKEYGPMGYRCFNYSEGRKDINQSMAGKEASDAFMSAYANIVKHNLPTYIKNQWHLFLQAIGTGDPGYVEPYTGPGSGVPFFEMDMWEVGINDVFNIPGRYTWTGIAARNVTAYFIGNIREVYTNFLVSSKIYTVTVVLEILCSVYVILATLVDLCKKKFNTLGTGLTALILDGYLLALALVMPVSANMYLHAYIFSMFALLVAYIGLMFSKRADAKIPAAESAES